MLDIKHKGTNLIEKVRVSQLRKVPLLKITDWMTGKQQAYVLSERHESHHYGIRFKLKENWRADLSSSRPKSQLLQRLGLKLRVRTKIRCDDEDRTVIRLK